MMMGQPGGRRRKGIIMEVGMVVKGIHGKELAAHSKPEVLKEVPIASAVFAGSFLLRKLWAILSQPAALTRMGFRSDASMVDVDHYRRVVPQSAASSGGRPDHLRVDIQWHSADQQDAEMATFLWRLVCASVRHRGMSMLQHSGSMPGCLVLLASPDVQAVQMGLRKLKCFCDIMCEVEKLQWRYPQVEKLIGNINMFWSDVCREVLAQCAQHDFQVVPPEVQEIASTILHSFGGTVLNERCFRSLSDAKLRNQSKKISRTKRYYHPISVGLLHDHGREEPSMNEMRAEASLDGVPRKLPESMYDAYGMEPSIDLEQLQQTRHPELWEHPSTSAQGMQVQVAAWHLLPGTGSAWHALLLPEDSIVRKLGAGGFGVVLKSCMYGVLLWPMELHQVGRVTVFRPSLEEASRCKWRVVTDWGQ